MNSFEAMEENEGIGVNWKGTKGKEKAGLSFFIIIIIIIPCQLSLRNSIWKARLLGFFILKVP